MGASEIKVANNQVEREIEDILQLDETIKRSLEIRDSKLSPVIHQTKETVK